MPPIVRTTASLTPTSGTDDGGFGQIGNSIAAIANDMVGIGNDFRKARVSRGKRQAQEDFNAGVAQSGVGDPVAIAERGDEALDMFNLREKSYAKTMQFLQISRAKEDAKEFFSDVALETKGDAAAFERMAEESLRGYVQGVPKESRGAVEQVFRKTLQKGILDRVKERRDHDVKEASASAVSIAQTSSRSMEALIRKHGAQAVNMQEYQDAMSEYRNTRDFQENSLDIIYSPAERDADDDLLERRLMGAMASKEVNDRFQEYTAQAASQRAKGVSEEDIVKPGEAVGQIIDKMVGELDLTADEAQGLTTSLKKDVAAAQAQEKIDLTREAAKEAKINEAISADASVKVSRGEMSYSDIDALREKVGDSKWATLTKARDVYVEKQKKKAKASAGLNAIRAGHAIFDPYDAKQRKDYDTYFNEDIAPEIMNSENPTAALVDHIESTGHFPKSVKNTLRALIRNGTPAQKIEAVETATAIQSSNAAVYKELPDDVERFVSYVNRAQDGSIAPEMAIERAYNAIYPDNPVTEARKKMMTSKFSRENTDRLIKDFIDDNDVAISEDLAVEAKFLFEDEFLAVGETMGMEQVQEQVKSRLAKTWGVSRLGSGEETTMRLPPEKVYGVPSMSDKKNAQWIRNQMVETVNKAFPSTEGIGGDAFLVSDIETYRGGDQPSYSVFVKDENGFIEPLIGEKGLFRFAPDFSTSREGVNNRNRRKRAEEKAISKARAERAARREWDLEAVETPELKSIR